MCNLTREKEGAAHLKRSHSIWVLAVVSAQRPPFPGLSDQEAIFLNLLGQQPGPRSARVHRQGLNSTSASSVSQAITTAHHQRSCATDVRIGSFWESRHQTIVPPHLQACWLFKNEFARFSWSFATLNLPTCLWILWKGLSLLNWSFYWLQICLQKQLLAN